MRARRQGVKRPAHASPAPAGAAEARVRASLADGPKTVADVWRDSRYSLTQIAVRHRMLAMLGAGAVAREMIAGVYVYRLTPRAE